MKKRYVHYGCGLAAPTEWENYDTSPTLKIQKMPIIGMLLRSKLNVLFPENVRLGNIIEGLPVEDNTADCVYCSHTLEHLSLQDFRKALQNTYRMLKPNVVFRCVVPDLQAAAQTYLDDLQKGNKQASIEFLEETYLGMQTRPRGLKGVFDWYMSNAHHLWMWDHVSLAEELTKAGFRNVRACKFNDSADPMFKLVENPERFVNAVALECVK